MHSKFEEYAGKLIVGIDLGTTKSGIAAYCAATGCIEMALNAESQSITPSVVGWDRNDSTWYVGQKAKDLAEHHPEAVARSIKRYIGRWFTDPAVQHGVLQRAFSLMPGNGTEQLEDVFINFGTDLQGHTIRLSAPEVSAKVLQKICTDAALATSGHPDLTGKAITHAVITVPAYFNDLQRSATILAGKYANLTVVDIINEPTAAALAYRDLVLRDGARRRILVYDLGGGTFDVSIIDVERDDDGYSFAAAVVDGDTHLGGDDIDQEVVAWLINAIEQMGSAENVKIRADDRVIREQLRQVAEEAKRALSSTDVHTIEINLSELPLPISKGAKLTITRDTLNHCAADVIRRTSEICQRAVETIARLTWADIDDIILVGGQTLMPAIQDNIRTLTGKEPHCLDRPQEAVALGAGEYARTLSLGGKAFQERQLINFVPLPVGIHLPLERPSFHPLIEANTELPTVSEPYVVRPAEDDASSIEIEILQGKSHDAGERQQCDLIGKIKIDGIPPGPSIAHPFKLTIHAEEDGTLKVTVDDTFGRVETMEIARRVLHIYRSKL